ncbi:MAG: ABC transporter substrate-binding protein [Candidatus Adiutrix sp.]|nr:ABC transporter substrate-binding protein [Candidatus Adiutrix sp.]
MQRTLWRILALLAALSLGWAAVPALAGLKAEAGPGRDQVFRAIYSEEPRSLDPQDEPDPAAWPVIMPAYDRLMVFEPGTAKPVVNQEVLQAARVAPNGLNYIFALREGRTFSDGLALNSEAALYSFDRLMSTPTGRRLFPHLHRLEIMSPNTFRLILRRPWPPFLASLALPQASLISPGLKDRPGDYLKKNTLGSGQYTLYDWRDHTIGLMSRPELMNKPRLAFAMFHYEPEPGARWKKMIAHEAHLTESPALPADPGELPPRYSLKKAPTYEVRYLAFNTGRSYVRMRNIRRAISFVTAELFKDKPGRLAGFFPAGLFYNAPGRAANDEYDRLEEGARILKEVGPPLTPLTLAFPADDPGLAGDAAAIRDALSPHGLPLSLTPLTGSAGRRIIEEGDYDLLLGTASPEIPAPDLWLGRFLDSTASVDGNPARFKNSRADQLIAEIAGAVGNEGDGPGELRLLEMDRAAKLAELAEIAALEAPYAFLYSLEKDLALDERLVGITLNPMWPTVWPLAASNLAPPVSNSENMAP